MKREYTAIDIFSGAGGLSIGACMAGIKPVMAVEYDIHAANTYKRNHPNIAHNVLQCDIKTVQPLQHTKKYPFLLFGGPPCQGFSIANTKTRNIDNPNNRMFKEYIRFIEDLEPEWFLFENVVGFKSFGKGEFAKEVEKELQNLGYETNSAVLNSADFGVPQKRSRFFIVGHKKSKGGIKFDFDKLEKKSHISVEEALHDLPSLQNGEKLESSLYKSPSQSNFVKLMRGKKKKVSQNFVTENKAHIIERYKVISQGENWEAAKKKGLLNSYSSTKHTHSGIYKRLDASKPSVTIANYRKSMLIHPYEDRGLSLREAARLQSFPDNFIFEGSLSFQQQQVGNAVPPLLAKAIFDEIIRLEEN
ncbi:MAG TPA: DNA cytosine methyltransferase [Flavobacteriia bacterium]|nr:DNA cytosine methyltransferase [Flavobacteriia bacterium]